MDTQLVTKQYRLQQWAAIIQDRAQSGLKIDEYCETHGITHHQYYYWLRKVRQAFLEVNPDAAEHPEFVDVTFMSSGPRQTDTASHIAAAVSVGRCEIRLTNYASPDFLRNLLGVIRNA